ncbi:hypothetical protein GPALN_007800 [Globodera pallida]|nr:hypothetical protein GPALN_007800 [Globodera pallida]
MYNNSVFNLFPAASNALELLRDREFRLNLVQFVRLHFDVPVVLVKFLLSSTFGGWPPVAPGLVFEPAPPAPADLPGDWKWKFCSKIV